MKSSSDAWIKKELKELQGRTFLMIVVVFAAIGSVLGYFLFSDILTGPLKKVAYAKNGSSMELMVETKTPSRARVEYGTAPVYLNRQSMGEDYDTKHAISFNVLPDKTHYFRLVLEDQTGRFYTSGFYNVR